jgi:poly(hydroxyalkanoate) depolymerase family esterase
MFSWLNRLRAWLLVRFGLWRRRWRRGRVDVPGVPLFLGQFPVRSWGYGLYTPRGLADEQSAPLVVLLHGCGQRALGFAYASGWTRFADRTRVRVLCPDQRRLANLFRCWNWFHPSAQRGKGELDVITAMIDDVATRVHVDANAISVVGMSAGGAMAALLAFHFPDRFRAVVSVAAVPLLGNHNLQSPQDVMRRGLALSPLLTLGAVDGACAPLAIIHGSADRVVNPRCAGQLAEQAVEAHRRSGLKMEEPDASFSTAAIAVTDYRAAGKLLVRNIEVKDLGHVWSGGPGGHPYCERRGLPLTALATQFLREVGGIAG